ncbi:MAG: alanyl-tRNA editing protein [Spirochaetes bacterium]|uniref:Alanine--tRNA ligase n=1 Tax=Candidatus Ornithospirochaeta stercoripullorum TaxID=2840899 RepID=A0A9D9H1J4_9SPIO|nr:alanyl-tRNA editing protein [Candidatus Ornithospirochaeta stercoripullorum]
MTDKLYCRDGYLQSIEAEVIASDSNGIVLDRTIFYPEGGGQPGDRGFFGKWQIIDTQKNSEGDPLHIINGDKPAVGTKALLTLDWEHRYFYMTEHSAQHLISALLFKHGIGTVAVHQGERFFTVETDKEDIDASILLSVEEEAGEAIRSSLAITQREMSHEEAEALGMRRSIKVEGDVKVVFIDSLDAVACGGVHLRSTKEIKEIQYCGFERIRSHVRTIWKCGDTSIQYRRQNKAIVSSLCAMLSAEDDSVIESVERLIAEVGEVRHELKNAERKIAEMELEKHSGKAAIFRTSVPVSSFDGVIVENDGSVAFIIDDDGRFMFHGTKDDFDALKTELPLKGGGRGSIYRGAVSGDIASILGIAEVLLNGRSS